MTVTQSVTAIVIFWAIIGGLGASLLLPAMQSLIHGNFEGAAQQKTYALVGAAAAVGAAIGPLLGGFVTTYLSWRVGFGLEVVIIAIVLSQLKLVVDVKYTGSRKIDLVGAGLSIVGMGGVVLGILVWQEGGEFVLLIIAVGVIALGSLAYWLRQAQARGQGDADRPGPVQGAQLPHRRLADGAAADDARRGDDRRAALLAGDVGVQRDAGRAVAGAAVTDDVRGRDRWPGRRPGIDARRASSGSRSG